MSGLEVPSHTDKRPSRLHDISDFFSHFVFLTIQLQDDASGFICRRGFKFAASKQPPNKGRPPEFGW